MSQLDETILQTAEQPKSVTVDGSTVNQRDLSELIAADKYLAQKAAMRQRKLAVRLSKIIPSGASD